jgi:hypothetical protein
MAVFLFVAMGYFINACLIALYVAFAVGTLAVIGLSAGYVRDKIRGYHVKMWRQ